jgi:hypothetical protein
MDFVLDVPLEKIYVSFMPERFLLADKANPWDVLTLEGLRFKMNKINFVLHLYIIAYDNYAMDIDYDMTD